MGQIRSGTRLAGRAVWGLFFTLAVLAGCGAPSGDVESASVTQAVSTTINPFNEPYTIGAWYFTAWSQVNDAQAFWGQSFGRWDPWYGVRDGFQTPASVPNNTDGTFIPRKPSIGFYDIIDQRVMDKHIVQAASRGLSYFAFYWYWDADAQGQSQISTPIHRFLSSANKGLLKFMISPMRVSISNPAPQTTLTSFEQRLIPFIVDTFFTDSSYLVTSDGRPVITDWDFGLAASDHAAGMQFLRTYTLAKLGKYPLILGMRENGPSADDDGSMCFANTSPPQVLSPGAQKSIDYAQMMQGWPGALGGGVPPGAVNVPCTTAGFDPRPWCLDQPWACGQGGTYYYYNTGLTVPAFQNHLNQVKSYLDANATSTLKALTIYAWNEWGEGGVIEPSVHFGTQYLDAIKTAFSLAARTTNTADVSLEATVTTPANKMAVFVTRTYQTLLGRTPSAAELQSYDNLSGDKLPFLDMVTTSPEYASKWSTQLSTANGTVTLIFQQLLGRSPTTSELSTFAPMVSGYGRQMLLDYVWFAPEHFAHDPIVSPNAGTATTAQGLIQLYRMLKAPDYFYTSDIGEISSAQGAGYVLEGGAGKLLRDPGANRISLYRCKNGPLHFLSKDQNCEGWPVEGPMGFGSATSIAGSADFIRFFSPGTGAHIELLSTDTVEIGRMPGAGFQREGTLMSLPSW